MAGFSEKQLARLEKHAAAGADARRFLDNAKTPCSSCGAQSTIFAERRDQIIAEAVNWFESPGAASDSHVAVRYVAALAELNRLQKALETRVSDAERAREKLYGDQTAGS